jgi:hypothetical protein
MGHPTGAIKQWEGGELRPNTIHYLKYWPTEPKGGEAGGYGREEQEKWEWEEEEEEEEDVPCQVKESSTEIKEWSMQIIVEILHFCFCRLPRREKTKLGEDNGNSF